MPQQHHDVASVEDIKRAGMREVEVDGTSILLVWDGDTVHAVGAKCPHAGAPLAEGICRGGRLVCPWHKATFCIRTGEVLEPPAVDALPRFVVRIAGQRVLLRVPADTPPARPPKTDARCFVIVGGGAAGAVAAQTLREIGFTGRIVMLDRENRVPYDRTLLSKYFLSGEPGAEKSPLQSQSFYREQAIERVTAEVTAIDADGHQISCADGSIVHYDRALLALGGVPKRPSMPGARLDNVFVLRSRADADAILAAAECSERAVVLGASFIGMEVAASLRERGLDVAVVGSEPAPFDKLLGAQVGAAFVSLHAHRGVEFHLGRKVAAIDGGPKVRSVVLDNGDVIAADLVVIGFGVTPATSSLPGLEVNDDGSVTVDKHLRITTDLYAAGDIARYPYRGDGPPIRVEHWRVAEQHGRLAARNMMGHELAYDAVPMFWTIQYMKRLDYIGNAASWDDVIVHGDLAKPQFLAYYVKDGFVVAVAGLDRDADTAALVELFSIRREWPPAALGSHPASVLAAYQPE